MADRRPNDRTTWEVGYSRPGFTGTAQFDTFADGQAFYERCKDLAPFAGCEFSITKVERTPDSFAED